MNKILSIISDIRVVIGIAVVVLILAAWLIIEKVRTKKFRKELEGLEKRYNTIKSIPLTFKMNKAVTTARSNAETAAKVNEAKKSYDVTQASLKKISTTLADCEDAILLGKLRKADDLMTELETDVSLTTKEANDLDNYLDEILAKETAQRQEVTTLKNRFRALKSTAQENASKLSYNWNAVETKITDTEKMFSTFEDWMYSSDFERANKELESIQVSMQELESMLDDMPSLLEDARGVVPNMLETCAKEYKKNKSRGVYLKHLDIENNLNLLTKSLNDDLKSLKDGNSSGIQENLDTYKDRINQLSQSIHSESVAFDQMKSLTRDTEELFEEANKNARFVTSELTSSAEKYGLQSLVAEATNENDSLTKLNTLRTSTLDTEKNYNMPATMVVMKISDLNQKVSAVNNAFKDMKSRIEMATGDEDRASKQLTKLQIIMNLMQVKIRKYKLPNISEQYEDDMRKAYEYIRSLDGLMKESPINMQLLNSTLQEALDFIYKLYNNVNNVVGTVVMVENTIVFGNRYRSTYADIDSELTRSELCFRNGEYTKALTIAIATIEKIHPGNYEDMIKENSKGA